MRDVRSQRQRQNMHSRTAASMKRPNIIVILVDDMGYSDIGCYGSEIRTPNLDRMAQNGVRFSQMYNCARCCPTRASLLTGLYPHQAGVGHMIDDRGVGPAYQGYLRQDCVTIGEALQQGGYRTLWAGKWHTSPGLPLFGEPPAELGTPRNPWPLSRGFDRFHGTPGGGGNYFNPIRLMEQEKRIETGMDYYYADGISDAACRMIEESSCGAQPFFLHVCYTAPHWPLHALPEDIECYRGKYMTGWDPVRTGRHEELKGMGILDPKWDISPRDTESRDFAADSPKRQEWEDIRMAVYAAQVDRMDHGVGTIMKKLRELNMEDNTLVMFLSDNGGCAEFLYEDDNDRRWPGQYARTAREGETCTVGNIEGVEPGPATTFMSYDLPWANASNSPFRLYKHWVHEGESFASLICGNSSWQRERPIYWEHEGNCAVRDAQWKLVSRTVDGSNGPWELYDMEADRTELNNLAAEEKATVERLAAMYSEWAERCDVLPSEGGKLIPKA